jgi:hypothetical protein
MIRYRVAINADARIKPPPNVSSNDVDSPNRKLAPSAAKTVSRERMTFALNGEICLVIVELPKPE